MELDKETFKKMFPNLAKEMESEEHKIGINAVRGDIETGEKAASSESFVHYMPDVIDFIRRCDTKEQAEEIIDFYGKKRRDRKAICGEAQKTA